MTAEEFADLVFARRIGAGKWQSRCPAHDDRHPSMTVTQGHSGILLRCWSHGCTPEAIVAAMGLTMRDLFHDATLTPEQRQQAAQTKAIRDAELARQRKIDREQRDRAFKLESLIDAIGAKLARSPDDRELGRLFHEVCDKLHDLESCEPHDEDGPTQLPEPLAVPGWIANALVEIGQGFDEAKGPLDAGLERIA